MKYELTNVTREIGNRTLYRIRALKDFSDVKKGDFGGFIESIDNLDQSDDCWIYDNALVYDKAEVYTDATVSDNAEVFGTAKVLDNAKISGNAKVFSDTIVGGNATVSDSAIVSDNSGVSDNAKVYGDTILCGTTKLFGTMETNGNIFWFSRVGSENGTLTVCQVDNNEPTISRGCFMGTLTEFKQAVSRKDESDPSKKEYTALIEVIKIKCNLLD